jgi:hypothetical protein
MRATYYYCAAVSLIGGVYIWSKVGLGSGLFVLGAAVLFTVAGAAGRKPSVRRDVVKNL